MCVPHIFVGGLRLDMSKCCSLLVSTYGLIDYKNYTCPCSWQICVFGVPYRSPYTSLAPQPSSMVLRDYIVVVGLANLIGDRMMIIII